MQTALIPKTLTRQYTPLFSPQFFHFRFPSFSPENPNFLKLSQRKWFYTPSILSLCASSGSGPLSYAGWDDLVAVGVDSVYSEESNKVPNILNSLGIDDKTYLLVYALGFVCALAISRTRVSSIIVFPACAIVFAVGFSIGFVNGGHMNQLSSAGAKKRPKEETFKGSIEKLRNLVDIFNGFDVKIVSLKNGIKGRIESNQISVADLEGYISNIESIRLSAFSARNMVEDCADTIFVENQEIERVLNQKSSKRRKEVNMSGFLVGLFEKNSVGSKPSKMKGVAEREVMDTHTKDPTQGNILVSPVEEKSLNSVLNADLGKGKTGFSGDSISQHAFAQDGSKVPVNGSRRTEGIAENEKFNSSDNDSLADRFLYSEAYSHQREKLQYMNNQRVSPNVEGHNELETWAFHDSLHDSIDFSINLKHVKTEASFSQEQTSMELNGTYMPSDSVEESERDTSRYHMRDDKANSKDDFAHANFQSTVENAFGSSPSSSVSDDMVFNGYLMEANSLLRQARDYLSCRCEEEEAENALYNCAKLLSRAIDMKPMSLLAVGQLGNTYLLHGELKLKISRELRTLLVSGDSLSAEKWHQLVKGLDGQVLSKDKLASILVNICEQCERLLVEAGRKYRLALSIDGNDMKALYNWGLALTFRAQLIADVGPEAAVDADKVFLAAIDKFDAMMSKSNTYGPNALFRWAVALQQRSRLRPRHSEEKLKLLLQAKRLYEDALHMDSRNTQVRKALSSCISELNYRTY